MLHTIDTRTLRADQPARGTMFSPQVGVETGLREGLARWLHNLSRPRALARRDAPTWRAEPTAACESTHADTVPLIRVQPAPRGFAPLVAPVGRSAAAHA